MGYRSNGQSRPLSLQLFVALLNLTDNLFGVADHRLVHFQSDEAADSLSDEQCDNHDNS